LDDVREPLSYLNEHLTEGASVVLGGCDSAQGLEGMKLLVQLRTIFGTAFLSAYRRSTFTTVTPSYVELHDWTSQQLCHSPWVHFPWNTPFMQRAIRHKRCFSIQTRSQSDDSKAQFLKSRIPQSISIKLYGSSIRTRRHYIDCSRMSDENRIAFLTAYAEALPETNSDESLSIVINKPESPQSLGTRDNELVPIGTRDNELVPINAPPASAERKDVEALFTSLSVINELSSADVERPQSIVDNKVIISFTDGSTEEFSLVPEWANVISWNNRLWFLPPDVASSLYRFHDSSKAVQLMQAGHYVYLRFH